MTLTAQVQHKFIVVRFRRHSVFGSLAAC